MRYYLVKAKACDMAVIESVDGVYYQTGVITDLMPEEFLRSLSRVNDVTGWEDDLSLEDILREAEEYDELWT